MGGYGFDFVNLKDLEERLATGGLINPKEAAKYLGLNVHTVRRYIREGKLNASKFGRVYRISMEDLKELERKTKLNLKPKKQPKKKQPKYPKPYWRRR